MTGPNFKSTFKTHHGTKWVKHTALELEVSTATVHRLAIMAEIPKPYEKKTGKIIRQWEHR